MAFCSRAQPDINVSILRINQSVGFSSNIKNFLLPPCRTLDNNTTSIVVKDNVTLFIEILTWTGWRLIVRGKYVYASFTMTLTVYVQASNRNSNSKRNGNGVSFVYSVWKWWRLEKNKRLCTMKRIEVVLFFVWMECSKLCIECQLLNKSRPFLLKRGK